jgi:EmrB/QacA subfamily drug resistance transporter
VTLARPSRLPTIDQRVAVGVVFVTSVFMNIIDTTIVNVALPAISRGFHIHIASSGAVSVGYLVSLAVSIPAGGWLGDRFGTKRVFMWSLALFTVASVLCALSASLLELVTARVLQGVGGGLLMPIATTMLFRAYTPAERVAAARVLVLPTSIAPALGPLLGGVLVDQLSWRWVFLVNIPVGLVALGFAALFVREHVEPDPGRFDATGFVLAAAGLGMLMFALSDGSARGWSSVPVVGGLVLGAAATVLLIVIELRRLQPLLRLRLLTRPLFAQANAIVVLTLAAFSGLLYVGPLFLQQGLGLSAFQSGLTTFPEAIGLLIGSQLVSRAYPRLGPRRLVLAGCAGLTAVAWLLAVVAHGGALWWFRLLMLLTGFSMISVQLPNQTVAFAQVTSRETGHASSLYNANRRFGAAIGVAALSSILAADAAGTSGSLHAYRVAFVVTGAFALLACLTALLGRKLAASAAADTAVAVDLS